MAIENTDNNRVTTTVGFKIPQMWPVILSTVETRAKRGPKVMPLRY
jgi:hypothetical protein